MVVVTAGGIVVEEGQVAAGKRRRGVSLLLAVLLVLLASPAGHAGEIPPVPAIDGSGKFVHDLAGVLYVQDVPQGPHKTIFDAQKTAFEEHDTPIIVVTIHRMMAYGYAGQEIQPFAEQWFNKWQIGTLNNSAGGHDRGILLLVSVGDRKGRIELGADWGTRFDGTCQQIMDNVMIPHFKQGDYAAGIAAGVEALGKIAAAGPQGTVASFDGGSGNSGSPLRRRRSGGIFSISWFPWWGVLLGCGLGVVLIYCGARRQRWQDLEGKKQSEPTSMMLVYIGVAVIVISIVTPLIYLVVIFFVMLMKKGDKTWGETLRSDGSGSSSGWGGGGGSFGGGGFGGGSSGGGGASGSW